MGVRQVCCSTSTILRLDCAAHLGGRLVISLVGLLLAAPVEALQGMLLLILWRHLIVVGCILLRLLLGQSPLRMARYQPRYFRHFTGRFRCDSPGSGCSLASDTSLAVRLGALLSWTELLLSRHHLSSISQARNLRRWVTTMVQCASFRLFCTIRRSLP